MTDLEQTLWAIARAPVDAKKFETHCFDLAHEALASKTEHFERVDLHNTFSGIEATYKCNIDGRTYTVAITPDKEPRP